MATHIGNQIKLARVAKGFTQEDLAERIHKTRPMISHIEKTGNISMDTLNRIAAALGVEVADLQKVNPVNIFATKSTDIENLKREIELLRELVENQKARILLMEKQFRQENSN